jgi:hypothetical protein
MNLGLFFHEKSYVNLIFSRSKFHEISQKQKTLLHNTGSKTTLRRYYKQVVLGRLNLKEVLSFHN